MLLLSLLLLLLLPLLLLVVVVVVVVMTFVMVNLGFLMLFSCILFVATFIDGFAFFPFFFVGCWWWLW